jgi:hypothetical protein
MSATAPMGDEQGLEMNDTPEVKLTEASTAAPRCERGITKAFLRSDGNTYAVSLSCHNLTCPVCNPILVRKRTQRAFADIRKGFRLFVCIVPRSSEDAERRLRDNIRDRAEKAKSLLRPDVEDREDRPITLNADYLIIRNPRVLVPIANAVLTGHDGIEPAIWVEIADEAALQELVNRETCPEGLRAGDLGIKPSPGWRPLEDEDDDDDEPSGDIMLGTVRSKAVLKYVVMNIAYHLATVRFHDQRRDRLIDEAVCSYEANGGAWEDYLCKASREAIRYGEHPKRHRADCQCAVEPLGIHGDNWSSEVPPGQRVELLQKALELARQGESTRSLAAKDGFTYSYGGRDWERAEEQEAQERFMERLGYSWPY